MPRCSRLLPLLFLPVSVAATACSQSVPPGGATKVSAPATGGAVQTRDDPAFAAADALRRQGRTEESAAAYRQLAEGFSARGDRRRRVLALLRWADAELTLGRPGEAGALLPQLRELAGDDPELGSRVAYLEAVLDHRAGDLDAGLAAAERALALAEKAADPRRISDADGVLATVHSLAGRYRQALAVNEARVGLERRLDPTSPECAKALNNLGIDYRHAGRFNDAEAAYAEAEKIYRAAGDLDGLAMVLYNRANLATASGDLDRGLGLKRESLVAAEQVGDRYGLGLLHNDLAGIYLDAGNLPAARREAEAGLAIDRLAGQAYGRLAAEEILGRVALAAGDPRQAEATLSAALNDADRQGFGKEQAMLRAALARALAALGRGREAVRRATEAVERSRALGDPEVELSALESLGIAREAVADPAASATYGEALDLLDSWRGRLALGDLAPGPGAPHFAVYEGAIRTLLARGQAAQAFTVAERARARFLLELVTERGREDDGISRDRATIRRRLRRLEAARGEAQPAAAAVLRRSIVELTRKLDRLESHLRRTGGAAVASALPEPASLAAVRSGLLAGGRTLLVYFWGDRDVYGWGITAGELRAVRLGRAADLAPRVDFLRSALADPADGDGWRGAAISLYRDLVAPLLARGEAPPGAELLVVADGPLTTMPFEVLARAPGAPPLGVRRRLAYGPSASILLALAGGGKAGRSGGHARAILAVGDPLQSGAQVAAAAGVGAHGEVLPPLPWAGREARAIAGLFHSAGADLLLGRRATVERWRALQPARYRFLHFASHAVVSARRPEDTRLLLAGGSLDLADIRHLRLGAELVTLSACETALGPRYRGEGVIGLPQAFLAAGAGGVVVSLWRLDDRETARFMRRFYEELASGLAPPAALLAVRRWAVAAGGELARPVHWAPFVLVGGIGGESVDSGESRTAPSLTAGGGRSIERGGSS